MKDHEDNTPKFTSGPWTFDDTEESFGRPAIIAKGAERYSTYGPVCLIMKRHPNYKSNAALIAAAPEMFCLLEEIQRESYDTLDEEGNGILAIPEETFSKIAKAFAKARGEGEK